MPPAIWDFEELSGLGNLPRTLMAGLDYSQADDLLVVGAKLVILTRRNLQISLNYNAEVGRASYLAQSIYSGVRLNF